mmetsp:Transcript_53357/g.134370  ORF Transcript_53357/g.134370 Transcript_53357/m.134370 type:complete len:85 (-) Transcript_53357:900-1154(-)
MLYDGWMDGWQRSQPFFGQSASDPERERDMQTEQRGREGCFPVRFFRFIFMVVQTATHTHVCLVRSLPIHPTHHGRGTSNAGCR